VPEAIEVRVTSGRSAHAAVGFEPGVAVSPFSVGVAGQWPVFADAVGPVHLFLAFDGKDPYVAAASPSLPVRLSGAVVGQSWMKAPVPCEIRFGAACLEVQVKAQAPPSTLGDGGALRLAAERAVAAAHRVQSSPPAGPSPPQAPGGALATVLAPRPQAAPRSPSPYPGALAGTPPNEHPEAAGRGAANGPVATGVGAKDNPLKAFWKTASVAKKISVLMAPIALPLSYWMLQEPAPPPSAIAPRSVGGPSDGSATSKMRAPAPSVGTSAAAQTANPPADPAHGGAITPAAKVLAESSSPFVGAGKKTPERQALDAAAAGRFDEAAERYRALAGQHPDVVAYGDAARILHVKSGKAH
jgi:hypothetical protein